MCEISENAKKSLAEWAKLQKKMAPLLARVKKYEDAAKAIEESVKPELDSYTAGSVETPEVTIVFNTRAGSVDWKKFSKDKQFSKEELDSYRKASVKAFTFKVVENPPEEKETPPAVIPPDEESTKDVDVSDPDQQEPQQPAIPAEPSDSPDSDAAPTAPEDSDHSDDTEAQKSLIW